MRGWMTPTVTPANPPASIASTALASDPPMSNVARLLLLAADMNRASDLGELLSTTLRSLDQLFGFSHSVAFMPDQRDRLVAIQRHGYHAPGAAEVVVGEALIGTVALEKKVLAVPLTVAGRLVGVLAVESHRRAAFDAGHEAVLEIIGHQIAARVERLAQPDPEPLELAPPRVRAPRATRVLRQFCYYRNDDCVFVDHEYLVRNVPAKILWRLLTLHEQEGRTQFTNRELRLDSALGLPSIRPNLESRLLLLRNRLEEKCREVGLVPIRRGRFALNVRCEIELVEKPSAW
jgi:adenylate cyclase